MNEIAGKVESRNIGAPISVPVFLPNDDLIENLKDKLPEGSKALVDSGYMTVEEVISFHQWHLMMCELGSNHAEFLNVFRAIKQELSRPQKSNLLLPDGY